MIAFQRIGVVVKTDADAAPQTLQSLLAELDDRGADIILDSTSAKLLAPDRNHAPAHDLGDCDLVIVIGGDGTLLQAGRAVAPQGVPLLGINLGRLGFMVDVPPKDLVEAVRRVLDGDYRIESRIMLEAAITDTPNPPLLAVNDVVVRHTEYVRMLEFSTSADGTFISRHRADGIIVCTPTGSTAYALSAGGPMMHPDLNAMALVPISPHTLSDRPLIMSGDSIIEVSVNPSDGGSALFTCDGQVTQNLPPGGALTIRKSRHRLKLVHPPGYDYFGILRSKLNWGRGAANKQHDSHAC